MTDRDELAEFLGLVAFGMSDRKTQDKLYEAASALSAQQPVAWRHSTPNGWVVTKTKHMDSQPLYASPPPAQQQPTEEEVRAAEQILSYIAGPGRDVRLVAEAVLRMAGK